MGLRIKNDHFGVEIGETPICFCASQNYFHSEYFKMKSLTHPKSSHVYISASTKTLHQKCHKMERKIPSNPTGQPHPTSSNPFVKCWLGPWLEMFHNFPCAQRSQGRLCTCNPIIQGGTWFSKLQILLGGWKSWWKISWKYYCHWSVYFSPKKRKLQNVFPVNGQNLAKLLGLKLNGYGLIKHVPNMQLWKILSPGILSISCILISIYQAWNKQSH